MSNTNTEVLTTAYEKLQKALIQADTVLPGLEEAVKKGNLDNYALVSQLEEKANNEYLRINLRQLGVKCDGTDELDTISNIINLNTYAYDPTFYFPSGDYLISDTLKITRRCNIEMDRGARIYTNNELDYLVEYLTEQTSGKEDVRSIKNHWYGGVLDGNDKVKCLIAFGCYTNFVMEDVCFYKFLEKGIMTRKVGADAVGTGGFMGNKLYFRNWTVHLGTIAIYNNGNDNKFYDITIQNIEQGIWCKDGLYDKIHMWQDREALFPTTKFAHVESSYAIFNRCIIDTILVGFTSAYNVQVRVTDCNFIASNYVYTEEVAQTYGFTFFSGEGFYYVNNCLGYIDYGNHTVCDSPRLTHIFNNNRFRTNGTLDYGTAVENTFEGNIRKGTLNNVDLNNYKTETGNYKIGDASEGTNFPTSSKESGTLEVSVFGKDETSTVVLQKFYPNSTIYKYYIRRYTTSSDTWTNWGKVTLAQDA